MVKDCPTNLLGEGQKIDYGAAFVLIFHSRLGGKYFILYGELVASYIYSLKIPTAEKPTWRLVIPSPTEGNRR